MAGKLIKNVTSEQIENLNQKVGEKAAALTKAQEAYDKAVSDLEQAQLVYDAECWRNYQKQKAKASKNLSSSSENEGVGDGE